MLVYFHSPNTITILSDKVNITITGKLSCCAASIKSFVGMQSTPGDYFQLYIFAQLAY